MESLYYFEFCIVILSCGLKKKKKKKTLHKQKFVKILQLHFKLYLQNVKTNNSRGKFFKYF